ncbi:MAG: transposase [bacterium]
MPVKIKPVKSFQPRLFGGRKSNQLSHLIEDAQNMAVFHPEILALIDKDRDRQALEKKRLREEDKRWWEQQGKGLGLEDPNSKEEPTVLYLAQGCTRMPAEAVLIFIMMRGYLGGFKDQKNYALLSDSSSLEAALQKLGLWKLPGASTILDNVNPVSEETLRLIMKLQNETAIAEGLDDFKKLYFDSTSIAASSAWPTESGTIFGLLSRIHTGIRIFAQFGYQVNLPVECESLVNEIGNCHKSISLTKGKKGAKKHTKKMYRKILRALKKLIQHYTAALRRAEKKVSNGNCLPSDKERLEGLLEWLQVDLYNVELCGNNARRRVISGEKVDASEKVLSIADQDAEMIVKGGREPVFGYKPQIGRSQTGLIVAASVPQGNASDAGQLRSITDQALAATGILPNTLSYDDGYTNDDDRQYYLGLGVETVSFSGAKGKAQIIEEWDTESYQEARNKRSMVESTMFILKWVFDLNRFSRRGRENATKELLSKVIVHNMMKIRTLRERKATAKAA